MPTLKTRRSRVFILGLIRGVVEINLPLSRLKFNVPVRPTRNFELLSDQTMKIMIPLDEPVKPLMNATK